MPRRTAKISRPDNENSEQSNIEIEPVEDDDIQEEKNENMLDLKDLKNLVFLGKLREIIDIAGYKFVVSTLTTKQQKEIMQTIMQFDKVDRLLDLKPVTVSYSVESVNGVSLEDLCEDDELEDIRDKKLAVILSLQSSVVERLYQVYEGLVKTSNKEIGLEGLKA
jgi:hypothetical protein